MISVSVSVIIPLYNSQYVLEKTIYSIIEQYESGIEIILVDDGSSDETWNICQKMMKIFSYIRAYRQSNKGLCEARNLGIKKATGKYILFCDHDDLFKRNLIKENMKLAVKYDADIVKFGYEFYSGDNFILSSYTLSAFNRDDNIHIYDKIDGDKYITLFKSSRLSFVWDCLFRRDMLLKNNIYFNARFKHGHEDRLFTMLATCVAKNIVVNNKIYYRHMDYATSTSNKYYEDFIDDTFYLLDREFKIADIIGIDHDYFVRDAAIIVFFYVFKCNNFITVGERKNIFKKMIKKYQLKKIGLTQSDVSFKSKFILLLYYLGMYRLLAIVVTVYVYIKR